MDQFKGSRNLILQEKIFQKMILFNILLWKDSNLIRKALKILNNMERKSYLENPKTQKLKIKIFKWQARQPSSFCLTVTSLAKHLCWNLWTVGMYKFVLKNVRKCNDLDYCHDLIIEFGRSESSYHNEAYTWILWVIVQWHMVRNMGLCIL